MNTFVQQAVESTIRNTAQLLDDGAISWSDARLGVLRIMEDLRSRYPMQELAITRRLGPWLVDRDAMHGEAVAKKGCGQSGGPSTAV